MPRYATTRRAGSQIQGVAMDPWLLMSAVGLLLLGLLMVASSSIELAQQNYHNPFYFLRRQTLFLLLSLVCALFVLRLDTSFWQRCSGWLLLLSFILLLLVLIPGVGHEVKGSTRWISLGVMRFQVAELAKLAVILYLAGYLQRHQENIRSFSTGFVKPVSVMALLAGLLLLQPDFGSVVVIFLTGLSLLFLAGTRLNQFFLLLMLTLVAASALTIFTPYRWNRLTSFLDPWANQFDSGYQLTQSLIAFGRGGWFGTGLGESIQKLSYLPEAHTDFLLAIIGEELGLIGIGVVLFLFTVLITRGFVIAHRAWKSGDQYAAYLAYGITLWFSIQAQINIGVNMGLLPTKGLTLPLLSYGGSSLLMSCIALALLMRIDYQVNHV